MRMKHFVELTEDQFNKLCVRCLRNNTIEYFGAGHPAFDTSALFRVHIAGDDAFNLSISYRGDRFYIEKVGMQGPKPLEEQDRKDLGLE